MNSSKFIVTEDLPIYKSTLEVSKNIIKFLRDFPKFERVTFSGLLIDNSVKLLRLIKDINKSSLTKREAKMDEFVDALSDLKIKIQLCFDCEALSPKRAGILALGIEDIGKQMSGWKKRTKKDKEEVDNKPSGDEVPF